MVKKSHIRHFIVNQSSRLVEQGKVESPQFRTQWTNSPKPYPPARKVYPSGSSVEK